MREGVREVIHSETAGVITFRRFYSWRFPEDNQYIDLYSWTALEPGSLEKSIPLSILATAHQAILLERKTGGELLKRISDEEHL